MVRKSSIAASLTLKLVLCLAACFGTAGFSSATRRFPTISPPNS